MSKSMPPKAKADELISKVGPNEAEEIARDNATETDPRSDVGSFWRDVLAHIEELAEEDEREYYEPAVLVLGPNCYGQYTGETDEPLEEALANCAEAYRQTFGTPRHPEDYGSHGRPEPKARVFVAEHGVWQVSGIGGLSLRWNEDRDEPADMNLGEVDLRERVGTVDTEPI